ncbi:sulfite exporter TauE/SafE family protein [uncultured Jatrophihabitans sp.]|uniref:sulfite exporter TauE/SafE family protein n=1 Tax=uncultured Jatrophihabitans sp. TaxID=1610747 RepID=UPI0035C948E6
MSFWQGVLVLFAGVWAGAINTVVGSGTLVTFPALLAVGLPPVTANISNSIGLFPGSFVGAYGYRRELRGQRNRVLALGPATVLGAAGGALLLLVLPSAAFDAIVPVLIVLSLVLVIFGRRITGWLTRRGHEVSPRVRAPLWFSTGFVGLYGGYFGAAQGVLQMGFLGVFLDDSIQRHNALKNVLAGLVNLVAAVVFVIIGRHIDWAVAGLVALGSILGGVLGARIGRRLSPNVLRAVIVVVGVAAIVKLLV